MKKVRESNFELLRCILMFMVVLVHYNLDAMGKAFTYVIPGTLNYYFVYFMESLAIIGTNGFVLLTGYFSWKKTSVSLRKPVGLLMYVVAYNVLFYVINLLIIYEPFSIMKLVSCFIPRNWYITLYIALMLISPFINIIVKQLKEKTYLRMLGVLFLLCSVWPTVLDIIKANLGLDLSGMNTVSTSGAGAGAGYTLINFVLLYMIGAAISKFDLLMYKQRWDIVAYVITSGMICLQQLTIGSGWSYANPLVIISCVFFFNIFRKLHFTSKIVNIMSGASLGVFLIHTQYFVSNILWSKCHIEEACKGSLIELVINMILCCTITYFMCSFLDMICRRITRPISQLLDKIKFLNWSIVDIKEE